MQQPRPAKLLTKPEWRWVERCWKTRSRKSRIVISLRRGCGMTALLIRETRELWWRLHCPRRTTRRYEERWNGECSGIEGVIPSAARERYDHALFWGAPVRQRVYDGRDLSLRSRFQKEASCL